MTNLPPWARELGSRMRERAPLKIVGTTIWVWVFFIGYFYLLRHPARPPLVMPLTWVDAWVPFEPLALVPYLSLWLYVGIAPGLLRGFMPLLVYGVWAGALCACGLMIFYLWPTQIPPLPLDRADAPGFALLAGIDAAGNACPSMHVAISVFTAVWIEHLLRRVGAPAALRLTSLAWVLAIAWSTLATRQHVAWDVVGGTALGLVFAAASLRWRWREPDEAPRIERLS
ncbi:MAG: phosphatase PAP2 family protein [Gammaproteobacteria bacterium]|uniref:phosphatase PAP2 family protein n=1 Tax=unclassified Pseudacidovorax TaxID=2620592 RepID=UPI001B49399C|nr:phosphatase PAP2 family protein [Pseudacidovorax sp.]MBP6894981.1 phosphatase PAP2 family protein [Pseudacidovorax sp.]